MLPSVICDLSNCFGAERISSKRVNLILELFRDFICWEETDRKSGSSFGVWIKISVIDVGILQKDRFRDF